MTNIPPGWRIWRSDQGKLWATRVKPFPLVVQYYADAHRTVSADDEVALVEAIQQQEDRARAVVDNPLPRQGDATAW